MVCKRMQERWRLGNLEAGAGDEGGGEARSAWERRADASPSYNSSAWSVRGGHHAVIADVVDLILTSH